MFAHRWRGNKTQGMAPHVSIMCAAGIMIEHVHRSRDRDILVNFGTWRQFARERLDVFQITQIALKICLDECSCLLGAVQPSSVRSYGVKVQKRAQHGGGVAQIRPTVILGGVTKSAIPEGTVGDRPFW